MGVYFALAPCGSVKIGASWNPRTRVHALRFRDQRVSLIGAIWFDDDPRNRLSLRFERRLLEENVASWIDEEAEWFHPTDEIAALVRKFFGVELTIRSEQRCRDTREALRRIRRKHKAQFTERKAA